MQRLDEPTDGWPWQIAQAMHDFPGLYADVGNHRIDDEALVQAYFAMLNAMRDDASTAAVTDRLMYGTDWFMEAIHPRAGPVPPVVPRRVRQALRRRRRRPASWARTRSTSSDSTTPTNENAIRLRARYDRFAPGRAPSGWPAR